MPTPPESKQQLIVWWVLWVSLMIGPFLFYQFLGGAKPPQGEPAGDSPMWILALVPFAIATIIRWVVLPKIQTATAALPLFIMGMALAEATCFLGLFVFPAVKQELFAFAVLGIFQFIPVFARRFFADDPFDRSGPENKIRPDF